MAVCTKFPGSRATNTVQETCTDSPPPLIPILQWFKVPLVFSVDLNVSLHCTVHRTNSRNVGGQFRSVELRFISTELCPFKEGEIS